MKYIKKYDAYFNSTKTNKVKPHTFEAWSYGWWKYAAVYNGKRIFNYATYSNTTSKHQSDARAMFNYNYDITLMFTLESLDNIETALNDEIKLAKMKISSLYDKIVTPRTRKSTNERRRETIRELQLHIAKIEELLSKNGESVAC